MTLRLLHTISSLLSLGLSFAVCGQQTDSLRLAPVLIVAQALTESYSGDSLSELNLREAADLSEVLKRNTSVYIKDYGPGNIATVSLRGGAAQHTSLYWNGMPINSPSLGLTDLSLMPSIFLSSVVLHSGAGAKLSGTGGHSGSIGLHSTQHAGQSLYLSQTIVPLLGASQTQTALSYGSSGLSGRTALHIARADNAYPYQERLGLQSFEQDRENASLSSQGIAQDINYRLARNSQLSWHGTYLQMDREVPSNVGIPTRGDTQQDEQVRMALKYSRIGSKLRHLVALGWADETQVYIAMQSNTRSEIETATYHGRYELGLPLGQDNLIRLRYDLTQLQAQVDAGKEHHRIEQGLYAEWEHGLGPDTRLKMGSRASLIDQDYQALIYSLGLCHELRAVEGLEFHLALSSNYRVATLNDLYWPELGNPDLQPEDGYSADMGLNFEQDKWAWSLSTYANTLSNLIVWLPGDDGRFRPVNHSRARNQGFELNGRASFVQHWSLDGRVAFTRSESQVDVGDNWVTSIYQPMWRGQLSSSYTTGATEWGLTYAYNSSVHTDYSHRSVSLALDPVHLWNLSAGWTDPRDSGLRLSLCLRNLLNVNYEYVRGRPIPGRYLEFKLSISLNEKP